MNKIFNRLHRAIKFAMTPYHVVHFLWALNTDLHELRTQLLELTSRSGINERTIGENGKTKVVFVVSEYLQQIEKVSAYKRLATCYRDMAPYGSPRFILPPA